MTHNITQFRRLSFDGWLFVFFILITIFEGALRKWLGMPTIVLMGFRDLVVLLFISRAFMFSKFLLMPNVSKVILIWSCVLVVYSLLQAAINQNNLILVVIGWRFWLFYLWFSLAVACSLKMEEFLLSIKVLVWVSVAMLPLAFMQSMLPPSHILNSQPDTDIEKIFKLTADVVRVTGTFSFTLGYTCFVSVILPFTFAGTWEGKSIFSGRYTHLVALVTMFFLSLFSGSRALIIWFFILYFIYAFSDFSISGRKAAGIRFIYLIAVALISSIAVAIWFGDNVLAYVERFETAGESEDFWARILVIFIGEPEVFEKLNFFGYGFGLGSNAGAMIVSGGERGFALTESEPGRNILEGGVLGAIWLLAKYILSVIIFFWASFLLKRTGNVLPLLLALTCVYAFASWAVTAQISAHAFAFILLAYTFVVVRTSGFRIKVCI